MVDRIGVARCPVRVGRSEAIGLGSIPYYVLLLFGFVIDQ
jgi:hypothetical protein